MNIYHNHLSGDLYLQAIDHDNQLWIISDLFTEDKEMIVKYFSNDHHPYLIEGKNLTLTDKNVVIPMSICLDTIIVK